MQNNLYSESKKYADCKPIRFHMPAHNGEDIQITTDMDITELSFSDNLLESNGIILNTEKNIAKAYSTNFAIMVTNGATSGVAIALHTAKDYGKKLLLVGNTHKSVHNYANLFEFDITYTDKLDTINVNEFDIIVITSPDYFGKQTDITALKNSSALVIVDASHGSHFAFCSKLPNLPTDIADIIILSFHKTLPVLTGGAGVICNDKQIYTKLCYSRNILHSTSPSYLIMSSIDNAVCKLYKNGEKLYKECLEQIKCFKNTLNSNYSVLETDDSTRLCICTNGYDGKVIASELEKENIYLEMTYNDILVAIVTPYNCKHLKELATQLNKITPSVKASKIKQINLSKIDTKCKEIEFIAIEDSKDRICAGNIGIYPPGVPIITINDVINTEVINTLTTTDCKIFGLIEDKIPVFKNK